MSKYFLYYAQVKREPPIETILYKIPLGPPDRTTEEIQSGELQWPFWTKLVVVAIGFTGGLVFMYIQCKVYIQICKKWKAYNRTIVVQVLTKILIKSSTNIYLKANANIMVSVKINSLVL